MKLRKSLAVPLLVVMFLTCFVVTVNAGCVGDDTGTDFGCGDIVNESCTFNEDMTCLAGHGLIIGADDITIDGNGYTLDGVSAGACDSGGVQRSGIYGKSCSDIVIKKLEIKNFCNGICVRYTEEEGIPLERITMHNCDIHHNGGDTGADNSVHGIKLIGVFDSEIKNCKVHDNIGKGDSCEGGGNGIFLKGISGYGAWGNLITENEIYNNKKGGFLTKMMCKDTEISYNEVWKNGQGGIILRCMKSETHDIHDNEVLENYGSGIFVGGPNNIIRDNTVTNNKNGSEYGGFSTGEHGGPSSGSPGKYGIGICLGRNDGSHNNEIISNEVCGNEGVDIEVCPTCEGNTGEENTCDTTFNYDDTGYCGCNYWSDGREKEQDLKIEEKSEEWVSLEDKTYNITYTIKSIGNDPAPKSTTSIKIDEIEVATDFVLRLASGESYTKILGPFTMPGDADTIKICADNGGDVVETDETNNCLESVFEYSDDDEEKKPDLTLEEKSEEWVDLVNKTYNITYTIKNIGDASAPETTISIIIDETEVATDSVPKLDDGENYTKTFGPFSMSEDEDTIKVCADVENDVDESDETNNSRENVFNFNASGMSEQNPTHIEKTEDLMNRTRTDNLANTTTTTPTPVEASGKIPVPTRTLTPTPTPTPSPTKTPKQSGFDVVFALMGLIVVAYVLMKRRGKEK